MNVLGIDIGTTTLSAVVYSDDRGVLAAKTVKNDSFLEGESWEKIQDPNVIYETAMHCVQEMLAAYPDVRAIGVTGQMHGVLCLDAQGVPVSPLYTWQNQLAGSSICEEIRTKAIRKVEVVEQQ